MPRRSVHSPFGKESVDHLAELAAAGAPFFALVHLWDAHTPRTYPARFEDRSHGRNAYERSIAGMDDWIGAAVDAAGPETVVVLTGDHGENVTFEPRSLRDQAAWRRINRRLPIPRWSQATVDHGVRSHSKRALRWAPRYFWNHGQTLLGVAGAGAAGRLRPRHRARVAANAGEPRRPRADPRRPRRRAASRRGLAGAEPRRFAAQGRRAAGASRGDGDRRRAVDPRHPPAGRPRRPPQADHVVRRRAGDRCPLRPRGRPARAPQPDPRPSPRWPTGCARRCASSSPNGPRRSRWAPTTTRRSPSGCGNSAICTVWRRMAVLP